MNTDGLFNWDDARNVQHIEPWNQSSYNSDNLLPYQSLVWQIGETADS